MADPIQPPVILVVEDEPAIATLMEETLAALRGYQVWSVPTAEQAIPLLRAGGIAALVLDVGLPGISGLDLYDQIHAGTWGPPVPVLIVTVLYDSPRVFTRRLPQVLAKPFGPEALVQQVTALLAPAGPAESWAGAEHGGISAASESPAPGG